MATRVLAQIRVSAQTFFQDYKNIKLSSPIDTTIVMIMDSQDCDTKKIVKTDSKSWHNYTAKLRIVSCTNFEKYKDESWFVHAKPSSTSVYKMSLNQSNGFIKAQQAKNINLEKYTTEWGGVADWHSPWFVLNDDQCNELEIICN